jgi:hypothetical protein
MVVCLTPQPARKPSLSFTTSRSLRLRYSAKSGGRGCSGSSALDQPILIATRCPTAADVQLAHRPLASAHQRTLPRESALMCTGQQSSSQMHVCCGGTLRVTIPSILPLFVSPKRVCRQTSCGWSLLVHLGDTKSSRIHKVLKKGTYACGCDHQVKLFRIKKNKALRSATLHTRMLIA